VQELNSLKTERSTMLMKITNLEENLLETQLQLERVTDEKAHSYAINSEVSN